MTAPDPLLDIVRPAAAERRYSIERTLAQPGFWLGLCAARNRQSPHDGRLVAGYERAAAALSADPERDPLTVPEIADWLERRRQGP